MNRRLIAYSIAAALLSGTTVPAMAVNEVQDISGSGNEVIVKVILDEAKSAKILLASYDTDGKIVNLEIAEKELASGENQISFKTDTDGVKKVFVWERDNGMMPITPVFEKVIGSEITPEPTEEATNAPTAAPTADATAAPTAAPTADVTAAPTAAPTADATGVPTTVPTEETTGTPAGGIIHLLETSIDTSECGGVTADGTTLTINAAGDYEIDGTLREGNIVVSSELAKKDAVNIMLNNVSVTSSSEAPFAAYNGVVTIEATGDNSFTYSNTAKYGNTDAKGAFYSKRDMSVKGGGTLTVTDNYKNGIVSGADLEIGAVDLTVNSADNAVKGNNSVKFTKKAQNVVINSTAGDGIKTDAMGDYGIEPDKGMVLINGGTITINAPGGDGIQADTNITVADGTLNITSGAEGIKANEVNLPLAEDKDDEATLTGETINGSIAVSGGTIIIDAGQDGIKAAEIIDISGGEISVTADNTAADASTYDGIQVGETTEETDTSGTTTKTVIVPGTINITGGKVNVINTSDDGIKSNDTINISGTAVVEVTSAHDAVKAYEHINVSDNPSITLNAGYDGFQSGTNLTEDSAGNESNYTMGDIEISGGTIYVKTYTGHTTGTVNTNLSSMKGIKAVTNIEIKDGDIEIDSYDDSIHSNYTLTITGGNIICNSSDDGVHADYMVTLGTEGGADDDFNLDVQYSYEGIEGSVINILSGTSYSYSTDDGINAAGDYAEDGTLSAAEFTVMGGGGGGWQPTNPGGQGAMPGGDDSSPHGMLYIKGGRAYIVVNGDGVDSNGNIAMTGGLVMVNGPTSGGNGIFDKGDGNCTFTMTGGTLIGIGNDNMSDPPSVTGVNGLAVSISGSAGDMISVPMADSSSMIVIPRTTYNKLYYYSAELKSQASASKVTSYSGEEYFGKTVDGKFYGLVKVAAN